MTKYHYRRLEVDRYDKHQNPGKRRGGREPDRYYTVIDTGVPKPKLIADEVGDDMADFEARANLGFIDYLDRLGGNGWEVISYTPHSSYEGNYRQWPEGTYLLMRRDDQTQSNTDVEQEIEAYRRNARQQGQ